MEILFLILGLIFLGVIIGLTVHIAWLGFALIVYFAPSLIAMYRKHPSTIWIFLINLFFGWSFVGWIIPMLWAFDFDKVIIDFIEYRKAKNNPESSNCGNCEKCNTEDDIKA